MFTEKLAEFVVETDFDSLPREAMERAKSSILDCLGVMLAGSIGPVGKLITQFARTMGGTPRPSVIAGGFRTSGPNASLANGTMGHALDYDDDSDTTNGHPTVAILPAVLALGEDRASGRDVLGSYVLGHEVGARLGSVLIPPHYEGEDSIPIRWLTPVPFSIHPSNHCGLQALGFRSRLPDRPPMTHSWLASNSDDT